ncbi:hypothetical protein TFKS16_0612 [Tannerella forsythia KS16]|uniref:Uncharacterized protein n=1 Tax=Tannerella forsythia (strain ATCC 43037 / JCM 10827 / CCUG 21028 A / KCTC 5666 / FDC 338) TaxID=203275 RepID=G8UMI3_TANFA|nr:hypothetical protein BFO_0672 [Tannerella forsythia 92A2]BAR48218.1 hypothetical protein TF3313_0646 [Tannerella forsythia 3313]BAR50911.1 hypothetical protein TFKS16_0612 [Tannerella forsythia KS16]
MSICDSSFIKQILKNEKNIFFCLEKGGDGYRTEGIQPSEEVNYFCPKNVERIR